MLKRTLLKLGITLASLLLAIVVAEGFLRVSGMWVGRHSDTMFSVMAYDPVIGWKMKPNINETVSFVDVENIPIRANSLGFWDKEFQVNKDPQKRRIVFLGDSMTWGLGVKAGERFSDSIEKDYQGFESLNFGIPGFGNDQELLVWRNIASKYKPDIVVLTIYSNDYADNMFVVRGGLRKPYFELTSNSLQLRDMAGDTTNFWTNGIFSEAAPPYASLFPKPTEKRSRVLHWLVKHSDLARLGYTVLRHSNESETAGPSSQAPAEEKTRVAAKSEAELEPTEQVEVRLMDALVKQLASEVTTTGAKFLVVISGEQNKLYDVQKLALESAKIDYVEATGEVLAKRIPGGVQALYFPYNKHWTAAGHRVVAELINTTIIGIKADK